MYIYEIPHLTSNCFLISYVFMDIRMGIWIYLQYALFGIPPLLAVMEILLSISQELRSKETKGTQWQGKKEWTVNFVLFFKSLIILKVAILFILSIFHTCNNSMVCCDYNDNIE